MVGVISLLWSRFTQLKATRALPGTEGTQANAVWFLHGHEVHELHQCLNPNPQLPAVQHYPNNSSQSLNFLLREWGKLYTHENDIMSRKLLVHWLAGKKHVKC